MSIEKMNSDTKLNDDRRMNRLLNDLNKQIKLLTKAIEKMSKGK